MKAAAANNVQGRSLVARLTVVLVAVLAALWIVIIALTIFSMYQRGAGDIDVELRLMANNLARLAPADNAAMAAQVGTALVASNRETSDPLPRHDEVAYQIWTRDGRLLAGYIEPASLPALPPGAAFERLAATPQGWYVQSAWSSDRRVYAVAAKRVSYYARRARGTALQLAGLGAAIALLSAAVFWWAFRVVIRPVRELAARVAARSTGDLSPVDDTGTFREIQPLLAALNDKLARIRELLDAERRFFADAAHELRTPLSAIGAQVHVLAHEPQAEARLRALRQVEDGIARGARVISKLLTLGKLEGADAQVLRARADLARIAVASVEAHRARAQLRGQSLQWVDGAPIECSCDAEQIGVLLDNLVENALQYCPEGSHVEVSVAAEADACVIRVRDDGPGIEPADRERAFARFQRLGAPDSVGSGLGLAIVRRIAELHGGSARIGDGLDGRGSTVEVRIPRGS